MKRSLVFLVSAMVSITIEKGMNKYLLVKINNSEESDTFPTYLTQMLLIQSLHLFRKILIDISFSRCKRIKSFNRNIEET